MKLFEKASIILACVYLLIAGIMNFTVNYPSELNISELALTNMYYIPKGTYLLYIILSIFALVKLLLHKQMIVHKIISIALGLSGLVQIFTIVKYYLAIRTYYKFISYRDIPQIASHIALVMIAVLMILISVNTFKLLMNNKTTVIVPAFVFAFRMAAYLASTLPNIIISGNSRYLINTLITVLGSALIGLAAFWASRFSLKPADGVIKSPAEET